MRSLLLNVLSKGCLLSEGCVHTVFGSADYSGHQLLWALLLDPSVARQADTDAEGGWHGTRSVYVLHF